MKKIITTFLLSGLFAFSANSQTTVWSEGFQSNIPATFTLIDVDGNTPSSQNPVTFTNPWITINFNGQTNKFAASTSFYNPPGQSDDWMITSSINLPNASSSYFFSWYAMSYSAAFPEDYEILVSTTGTNTVDFTLLTTVNGENPDWTQRVVDLSSYAGQTIYLAIRNISNDNYLLFVDELKIEEVVDYDLALNQVDIVGALPQLDIVTKSVGDVVSISTVIKNEGKPVTSFDLNWSADGRTTVKTHSFSGINLNYLEVAEYAHDSTFIAANANSVTNLEVWVSNVNAGTDVDQNNNSLNKGVFVNSGITVPRKALLEEFTTAVCQFCPDGGLKVEEAVSQNSNIIPVGIHSGFGTDAMTTPAATAYANFTSGAPTAMTDRIHFDGEAEVAYSRATQTDTNLWMSRANMLTNVGSPVSIGISGTYTANTKTASITVQTNFVDYVKPGDLRVVLYVIEDSVTGTGRGYDQVNAYYGTSTHPFYQMGTYDATYYGANGGAYTIKNYVHRHVLRSVFPTGEHWGDPNSLTASTITPNTQVSNTYSVTLNNAWDESEVSFIAYVAYYDQNDLSNRYILNAESITLNEIRSVGIEEQAAAEVGMEVYPNPFKQETNVGFELKEANEVNIQVYDVAGKLMMEKNLGMLSTGKYLENIQMGNLESGFYFVRLNVGNSTAIKKVSMLK